MRRTFKAYDEGGTGLLSVADFRKVSSAVGRLRRPNGEQWPEDLKRGPLTPRPRQRPRCERLSRTSLPWDPQVIEGYVHLPRTCRPQVLLPEGF